MPPPTEKGYSSLWHQSHKAVSSSVWHQSHKAVHGSVWHQSHKAVSSCLWHQSHKAVYSSVFDGSHKAVLAWATQGIRLHVAARECVSGPQHRPASTDLGTLKMKHAREAIRDVCQTSFPQCTPAPFLVLCLH
eukprot:822494-Pelagomonas_calceolata.AAC.4